jgi:hypothetical protein
MQKYTFRFPSKFLFSFTKSNYEGDQKMQVEKNRIQQRMIVTNSG